MSGRALDLAVLSGEETPSGSAAHPYHPSSTSPLAKEDF